VTGLLADLTPLRNPAFRNLWAGTSLSVLGGQFTAVAVLYQVWQLTHSAVWTGVIGIVTAVPVLVFGFVGGGLADRLDRRRLIVVTTAGQLAAAAALAAQALARVSSLPLVLTLVGLTAGFVGLGAPARRTLPPRLLPPAELRAGLALQNLSFQASMLVGPALAGLAIGVSGLGAAYTIDATSFVVALVTALRLPPVPPELSSTGDGGKLAGLRLIRSEPVLRGSFQVDLAATVLAMPVSLFPLVNQERFGGNPRTLGLFLSSLAVGGVVAGVFSGVLSHARRPGRVQLAAAAVWGLALAGFGLTSSPALTFMALAVAGAADVASVVTRGAMVQAATPDAFRGRVGAVEIVVGVAGPEIGNFRGGVVASLTGAGPALAIGGGAAAAVVAAVALTNRPLRNTS
jgi:MFS family permease